MRAGCPFSMLTTVCVLTSPAVCTSHLSRPCVIRIVIPCAIRCCLSVMVVSIPCLRRCHCITSIVAVSHPCCEHGNMVLTLYQVHGTIVSTDGEMPHRRSEAPQ